MDNKYIDGNYYINEKLNNFTFNLNPNNSRFYENGGTLIKFGKNLRFDVGSKTLLHAHAFGFNHISIGTSLASLIGGLDAILSL